MMNKVLYGLAAAMTMAGLASAEEKCQTLRGVLQAYFEPSTRSWVNEIHAVVDDTKMVTGSMTAITRSTTTIDRGIGIDRDGLLLWNFGEDGSVTAELPIGLHLRPAPGPQGIGVYRGMGKIVDGTGAFDKAAGTILYEGTWVLWFVPQGDSQVAQGRWNADVTMRICKVNQSPLGRR